MHRLAPVTLVAALIAIVTHVGLVRYLFATSNQSLRPYQSDKVSITLRPIYQLRKMQPSLTEPKLSQLSVNIQEKAPEHFNNSLQTPNPTGIYYFKSGEVTQKPEVFVDLPTDFLMPSVKKGASSSIVMTLFISNTGAIDSVELPPDKFSANAEELVIAAFKSMQFQPALIGNTAVPSAIQIEVFGTINPDL